MKFNTLSFYILLVLFFFNNEIIACDSIKAKDFNSMAQTFKKRMKAKEKFSTSEAVSLTKVYNTFHLTEQVEKSKTFALQFIKLFEKFYLKEICGQLDCNFGKGMTIYSKKYNLYIGASMTGRCEDHFNVKPY